MKVSSITGDHLQTWTCYLRVAHSDINSTGLIFKVEKTVHSFTFAVATLMIAGHRGALFFLRTRSSKAVSWLGLLTSVCVSLLADNQPATVHTFTVSGTLGPTVLTRETISGEHFPPRCVKRTRFSPHIGVA